MFSGENSSSRNECSSFPRIVDEEDVVDVTCSIGWKIVVALLLAFPAYVRAQESPMAMIRHTVEQATVILQDPANQGKENFQLRITKLRALVEPQFDVQEVARRALGIYWRDRTEEERNEFIRLFTDLVQKTWGRALDRYNTNAQFFYDQERIDGKFAEVDTRISAPGASRSFSLSYKLHQVDNRWRIYDVVAENVSLVRNYRNQFNRILSKSSYQDLLQILENKIKELDTTPVSTQERNTAG
jgi:phospholipid transport system substrate-binding protein